MAPLQRARAMAGPGAEVEHRARVDLELVEPCEQLVADAILQRRGGIVVAAGAIERLRHRVPIDAEDLARIVHAASACRKVLDKASTCDSSCAADNVTRSRAVPAGTVGGRIAVTRNPCLSSCALSANARAASPTITGTMVVVPVPGEESGESAVVSPSAPRNRCAKARAFSRRQDSRWLTRNAARVAAAIAGGSAVV